MTGGAAVGGGAQGNEHAVCVLWALTAAFSNGLGSAVPDTCRDVGEGPLPFPCSSLALPFLDLATGRGH